MEAYHALEDRMKVLAEADGDVFLPNAAPSGKVDYVFLCMEPSLGRWASSPREAKEKVEAGFRNFLFSMEDFLLHHAIREYLCKPGQHYHLTDLSKGAMLTKRAAAERKQRYDKWYSLLLEELELGAKPEARIFAVGNAVDAYLRRRDFGKPVTRILHYSGLAAHARARAVVGHEERFAEFSEYTSLNSILATAEAVMSDSRLPARFRDRTLARLSSGHLSESRRQLLFSYMLSFETIAAAAEADSS